MADSPTRRQSTSRPVEASRPPAELTGARYDAREPAGDSQSPQTGLSSSRPPSSSSASSGLISSRPLRISTTSMSSLPRRKNSTSYSPASNPLSTPPLPSPSTSEATSIPPFQGVAHSQSLSSLSSRYSASNPGGRASTSTSPQTLAPSASFIRSRRTSSIPQSGVEGIPGSSGSIGRTSSSRRKAPPPLSLVSTPAIKSTSTWESALVLPIATGYSSGSSQLGTARSKEVDKMEVIDMERVRSNSDARFEDAPAPKEPDAAPRRLHSFVPLASPRLDTSIPTSDLGIFSEHPSSSSATRLEVDAEDDDEGGAREDDTVATGFSFLSSSSSSGLREDTSSSFLGPSTTFSGTRLPDRQHPAIPSSASAAASLSSNLSPPLSFQSSSSLNSEGTSGFASRSPSGGKRSGSGSESPTKQTDRSDLIGLGELATPRWTSRVLEKRWGSENDGEMDEFDLVGSYAAERDRDIASTSNELSPTVLRSSYGRPLPPVPLASHFSAAAYTSSQSPLFPGTAQNTLVPPSDGQGTRSAHSPTTNQSPLLSPAYSLDAISIDDAEDPEDCGNEKETVPTRILRQSFGAAASAPVSAVGTTWTGSLDSDMVGLGFNFVSGTPDRAGVAPVPTTTAVPEGDSRRLSAGSMTSSSRSNSNRTLSVDGKATKTGHHRRSSASKMGFSHLPPSPGPNLQTTTLATGSGVPIVPLQYASPARPIWQPPSAATPRHSHQSVHSHHSSPSVVAASILRQTREFEGVEDMDSVAAADSGTADALRRLDGLSSHRLSRINPATPASAIRTRTASGETANSLSRRNSEDGKTKRRTRSSTGGSSVALASALASAIAKDSENESLPKTTSTQLLVDALPTRLEPTPTRISSPGSTITPGPTNLPTPRSPLSPPNLQSPRSYTHTRPRSSNEDVPFPSSASPFKRGSSSSTSVNTGTSTSAAGSRDSTSGTSLSGSSMATTAARSAVSKNRRGSVGSDVSSIHSSGEGTTTRLERTESRGEIDGIPIPPVPPIPKDWEAYRPPTAGTTSSSAQNSPRFDQDRRPSSVSVESSLTVPSSANEDVVEKSPSRKWSISFRKSKSPKPPSIKESASYSDLTAPGERARKASIATQLSDSSYSRRMAASTNDIVGLASGSRTDGFTDTTPPSVGFKGRESLQAGTTRTRTSSNSSGSTTRTTTAPPPLTVIPPPPSVITTSPGRSRSSLLSPRRSTSTGIPFFSRKGSAPTAAIDSTPPPPPEKSPASPPDERSGRKSILGLNFLRSTASRKEKEKASPGLTTSMARKAHTSMVPLPKQQADPLVADEFGRRASAVPKTSSLMMRKRGKTLPGSSEEPTADLRPLDLPPLQMPKLSAATVRRVDSLSSNSSRTTPTSTRTQPSNRISKLQDSAKGNLPTIAGSPSSHAFPTGPAPIAEVDSASTTTPPPKSHTPTKIPRLYQRASAVTSPRLLTPRASNTSMGSAKSSPPASASVAVPRHTTRQSYSSSTGPHSTNRLSMSASSSTLSNSLNDTFSPSNDFGFSREPGLGPGEKTLSTRRRLDSEPSHIPRSRSTSTTTGGSLLFSSTRRESVDHSSTSTSATPQLISRAGLALPRNSRRQSLLISEETQSTLAQAIASPAPSRRVTVAAVDSTRKAIPTPTSNRLSASASESSSSVAAPTMASARKAAPRLAESTNAVPRRVSTSATIESASAAARTTRQAVTSKMAIPSRMSKSATVSSNLHAGTSTESGRSSSTSQYVSEDEIRGDEEMAAYVRRQRTKKLAAGISAAEIQKMFEFPDPTEPLPALTHEDAIHLYSRYLTEYEMEEIRGHEKIYFVGPNCEKKPASKANPTNNFGYDDERGDYLLVPHDHILYRYEVIDVLGKGSFGQVLQCRDHQTGDMVAIKIIRNKKRFHHQALVEIKVLENLVKWDPDEKHYVIRMVDSFTFRGHLCIVTELLSINLYELVKANSFAGFSTSLIRRFTIQILGSLSLLRHHRVVHCDLKPENILLKHPGKSAIKVIDFGSSCFEHEKVYTYIQSRFYRSPEVILGMNYHMAIDMWSLGCIIAEMYTGYPIFPGENEQEQLACIIEVMGLPEKYLIDRSSRKRLFFDSTGAPRPVVNSKGRRRRPASKTLAQVLKSDDELFVDFVTKCLTWDPDRRLKPDPALRHPWIVALRQQRNLSPIPARVARTSLGSSTFGSSSGGSTSISSPNISSPRRKVSTSTQQPPATAPVERTFSSSNVSSTSTRLTKGSSTLPTSSSRFFVT